ncbi:pentapeptide repeat-containing protein [Halococcoides cellulosivorans]
MANIHEANLGHADLSDANLIAANIQDADYSFAELPRALLWSAKLHGTNLHRSDLSGAEFLFSTIEEADFTGANLEDVDLSNAEVHNCIFEGANLTSMECDGATFGGNYLYAARLLDIHISDRTNFEAPPGDVFDADPIDTPSLEIPPAIDSIEWIVLNPDLDSVEIDAEDHHLRDPDPSIFEIKRRGLRRWFALRRMDDPDTDEKGITHFEKARNAYRERERLYRENSLTDRIGDAYEGAKRAQHREALAKGNWFSYVGLAARKWTMGYGERPWLLVGISGVLIIGSAVFYPMLGGVQVGDGSGDIVGGSILTRIPPLVPDAVASLPLVEPLAHHGSVFLTSLYFSVITFTTLGYGGIQPHGSLVKAFASLESLIGTIILAMFVAVYARNKMR